MQAVRILLSLCIAALLLGANKTALAEDPSNRNVVLAGMAMALPTYALGVSIHEGSHALAAKTIGATITSYSLIPGRHPVTKTFYFGYVSVVGIKTDRQRAWFLMAPKLTDTVLLSGFALLQGTGSMPQNRYGQTALLVLATGFWVDFTKDIFSFSKHNDTIKVYSILGLNTELKRFPARLVHLGLSAALGYSIFRGYDSLFKGSSEYAAQPLLLPMWDARF